MKVLYGGFVSETNSFTPVSSRDQLFYIEPSMITKRSGAVRGAASVFEKAGYESVFTGYYSFRNHGPIEDDICEEFLDELLSAYDAKGPFDAISLALHGATQLVSHEDGCGYILRRVREHVGEDVVICASSDMHGNITPEMMRYVDAISGWLTYPHTDYFETGARSARQALEILQGKPFYQANVRIPMIIQAESYNTDDPDDPFRTEVIEYGHTLVREGKIIDFSVYQMQPWLDVSCGGSAILVSASDKAEAEKYAKEMAHRLFDLREKMHIDLCPVDEVLDAVMKNKTDMPVILVDSADSSSAGSSADSSFVLEKMLERGDTFTACMQISDPRAVEKAFRLGVGATGEFELGGYYEPEFHHSIKVTAYVKSLHDGIFDMMYSGGTHQEVGRTAVLQIGNIDMIVFTAMRNTSDPSNYRCFGVEPTFHRLVTVKSATNYKKPYRMFSTLFYPTDTPGGSSANLPALPFEHLPGPFWPFDKIDTFDDTAVFARGK